MAVGPSVLAGRRDELAALGRALDTVAGGRSSTLLVRGEPGIGKSRLLDALVGEAGERDMLVLAGRAAELERDITFAVLADAFEPLLTDPGEDALAGLEPEQLRVLAAVLPAAGPLAGVTPADVSGERHHVARAVRALLERLAADRPLVLVLDDVHWADPASADVLALLLHRLPRAAVLLALAARTGRAPELDAALVAAEQHGTGRVVELGPLPLDAVEMLLPRAGRATRERLHHESGGNPFYLQALARTVDGAPVDAAGAGLAGVPQAVRTALGKELAALSDGARALAEGAAVAGDPFEPELAGVVADLGEGDALAALDDLLAADLVRPTPHPRRFRFRHPLVRRAVYEGAGGGWRLAAHARAVAELAARGATPAQRAHHLERAARPGDIDAVEELTTAAQEAVAVAPATAASWYEAALRLLPDGPDHDPHRVALLGGQGQALVSAGRPAEARTALRRVLAMLPREAADERVGVVEMLADVESLWLGELEEARRLAVAERDALGDGEPLLAARLTFALVRAEEALGDHGGAESLAANVREVAHAHGDRALEANAAAVEADAAHCSLRRDDPAALAEVDRKIAHAQRLADALPDERVAERLQALFWLGVAHIFTGAFEPAGAATERGLAVARRTRQGLLAPSFLCVRSFVDAELGHLDTAERDADEALESALLSGNDHLAYWSTIVAARIAIARGDLEQAVAHAEHGWRLRGTVAYSQVGFTMADARVLLGDPEGALAVLETFGGVNPGLWTLDRLRAVDANVRALLALDRVEEAAAVARSAPAEVGGRRTGVFGAMLAHIDAGVLVARGQPAEAARVALAGARAGDAGLSPLSAGRCRILAGEALAAAGRTDAARAELRRAADDLEARGAWGVRDAALRALRRLGDRPRALGSHAARAAGGDRLAALTSRESEVAALVAEGNTNAQVAARLQLSERTVEKHVSSMLAKLGLSSRTGVVHLFADARSQP